MPKITLTDLADLQNEASAVNAINANNTAIENAFENTLSRDGTSPDQMTSNLDMNSNQILNLPTPTSNYEPLRVIDRTSLNAGASITVSTLPAGGTINQVLKKNSSTDYDASWATVSTTIPTGGATGSILTKNSASDYDASWVYAAATVLTPEQFGYSNYGSGDAGIAINAALASRPGGRTIIELGEHTYNVVTPIFISTDYTWIRGQGGATLLEFSPVSNNQTCITYNASPITTGIYYGRVTDMNIHSSNTSFVKTALNLVDIGDMEISGLIIGPGWTDTTNNSVCIKTNGRQCTVFSNLGLFGDLPVVLKTNVNQPTLCTDHFRFTDCNMLPYTGNPAVTADPTIIMSNLTFNGYQAWSLGTYGFYHNGSGTTSRHWNISFNNIRTEQGSSAAAYSIYFNAPAGEPAMCVNIRNCTPDPNRKGIFLRNVMGTIADTYYAGSSEFLNVDTTCPSIKVDNCRVEVGATQNIGGLTTKYSYNYTGAPAGVPANALYNT